MTGFKSAILGIVAAIGMAAGAQAATVASVDVPFLKFDGIIHEIAEDGFYTLDFAGTGLFPGFPDYLGFAAYVFAEATPETLPVVVLGGTAVSAFDGASIVLGFLEAGVDFAAGILSVGDTTMSLVRIDDEPAPVPLPATLPLLAAAMGVGGLAAQRRKRA